MKWALLCVPLSASLLLYWMSGPTDQIDRRNESLPGRESIIRFAKPIELTPAEIDCEFYPEEREQLTPGLRALLEAMENGTLSGSDSSAYSETLATATEVIPFVGGDVAGKIYQFLILSQFERREEGKVINIFVDDHCGRVLKCQAYVVEW